LIDVINFILSTTILGWRSVFLRVDSQLIVLVAAASFFFVFRSKSCLVVSRFHQ